METEIIYSKMESLSRCIQRIEEKTPQTREDLAGNIDIQDIIILNLERAVQQSVDAGLHVLIDFSQSRVNSMADVFLSLSENKIISKGLADNLIGAVGFRNIAVHEYRSIDWNIVWKIIQEKLNDFKEYQRCLLDHVS